MGVSDGAQAAHARLADAAKEVRPSAMREVKGLEAFWEVGVRPLPACGAVVVREATNMAAASVERGAPIEAAADGAAEVKCRCERSRGASRPFGRSGCGHSQHVGPWSSERTQTRQPPALSEGASRGSDRRGSRGEVLLGALDDSNKRRR
ncbi:unnamed protein product [Miscanthus lutarioriparius]|uniref:Uncharacterized protein n=1 Tax=Miscanthus lutarioriparius TaxID=422564 RepID=A0A811SII3_9POAL|nr:unnamed protein product [Miscanthus lutarioriparius]